MADSHFRLLDRNLNAIRFLIPGPCVDLWHQCSVSSLCVLYKIYHNRKHPLYWDLPCLFYLAWIIRDGLSSNNLAFSVVKSYTTWFSRSFIPAVTRFWNYLFNLLVESVQPQNFKCGANAFLSRLFFFF